MHEASSGAQAIHPPFTVACGTNLTRLAGVSSPYFTAIVTPGGLKMPPTSSVNGTASPTANRDCTVSGTVNP